MSTTFKPLEALLSALLAFPKGASQEDVILHVKPDTSTHEKSLKQAFYNAKNAGLIYAKNSYGERYWHLTEMGKARQEGKELQLSQPVEKITQEDIDKTIQQFGEKNGQPTQLIKHGAIAKSESFGANFSMDGKFIIWNRDDEVVFNPPQAADLIAFIANQLPWVEYCKQFGSK